MSFLFVFGVFFVIDLYCVSYYGWGNVGEVYNFVIGRLYYLL